VGSLSGNACNDEKKRKGNGEAPEASRDRPNVSEADQPRAERKREISEKKCGKGEGVGVMSVAGQEKLPSCWS
jgi:hypothetical protein